MTALLWNETELRGGQQLLHLLLVVVRWCRAPHTVGVIKARSQPPAAAVVPAQRISGVWPRIALQFQALTRPERLPGSRVFQPRDGAERPSQKLAPALADQGARRAGAPPTRISSSSSSAILRPSKGVAEVATARSGAPSWVPRAE